MLIAVKQPKESVRFELVDYEYIFELVNCFDEDSVCETEDLLYIPISDDGLVMIIVDMEDDDYALEQPNFISRIPYMTEHPYFLLRGTVVFARFENGLPISLKAEMEGIKSDEVCEELDDYLNLELGNINIEDMLNIMQYLSESNQKKLCEQYEKYCKDKFGY